MYLIRGITAEIFKKLKPYITIYGDGQININTAGKEVLTALGLNDVLEDGSYPFKTLSDLNLTPQQKKYLTVSSSVFSINVTSVLNNSKLAKRVNVVLQRENDSNDSKIKIKYWHEN